jgi:NADH-quinone oxidoreductase subunit A
MIFFFDYLTEYNGEYNIYFIETYYFEYEKIVIFFLLTLGICSALIIIAYLLSLTIIRDSEKLSEYECGFEPFDNATRHPFDVHFYVVGILFLIFDVEIALIFP